MALGRQARELTYARQRKADAKDYKGLADPDLSAVINSKEEDARAKLVKFVPSLGDVAKRIIDDLPAKIGTGIHYAIEHPYKTLGGIAVGVAASVLAPELALAVGVGALGLNATKAGGTIIGGYITGDPAMVWHGADETGDVIVEAGKMVVTHAAMKGLGAVGKPIVSKLMAKYGPTRVVPEQFPAAKMEGPVRAEIPGVGGPKTGKTLPGGGGGSGAESAPKRISLPTTEPPPTKQCFVAGTQVLALGAAGIADKSIETIAAGDVVLAQDPESGEMHLRNVRRTFAHLAHRVRTVTTRDRSGHTQSLLTTDGHPFFVEGVGFVNASALVEGEPLRTFGDEGAVITSTSARDEIDGVMVFNFEVDEDHDYFVSAHAGDAPLLVHNDCIEDVLAKLEQTDPNRAAAARKGLEDLKAGKGAGKVIEFLDNLGKNKFGSDQAKAEADAVAALVAAMQGGKVVPTAWSLAQDEASPAATALRAAIAKGTSKGPDGDGGVKLYRIGTTAKIDPKTGLPGRGSEAAQGQFWSPENPLTTPGYAAKYGIPQENIAKADFFEVATLKPGQPFVVRPAPPPAGNAANPGGGEVVTPENGVRVQQFTSAGKPGPDDLFKAPRLPPDAPLPAAPALTKKND